MAQHGYLREGYGMWGDSDERDERDRGFMFDEGDRFRGDDSREWFGGRDAGELGKGPGSHPDDHYRSWRQKQLEALDRDYEDYCREREQQFHQDFDSWRRNRQGGARATGSPFEGTMELDSPTVPSAETQGNPSPMDDATLGTNNSENSTTGRGGR